MIGIVLGMSFMLFCLRGSLSLEIWCSMTKGERKKYKKSCSFLNRWFFLSAPDYVRDKYVKSEKKYIRYSQHARQNRFICIVLHVVYAIAVIAAVLLSTEPGGHMALLFESICIGYWGFTLATYLFVAVREYITFSKYHRSRCHHRS